MASHRLTLAAADATADDGAVMVTIERVAAAVAVQASDEARIFSLHGVMPGKRAMAWLLIAAVLAVFLAWPLLGGRVPAPVAARTATPPVAAHGFAPDQLWSSGPLSKAHASLSNRCGACHQKGFVSVTDAACSA